jgi:hypothetical protein
MFSACLQKVNLKFLIYFTSVSVLGPRFAQEIPAPQFVELCLDMVVSET